MATRRTESGDGYETYRVTGSMPRTRLINVPVLLALCLGQDIVETAAGSSTMWVSDKTDRKHLKNDSSAGLVFLLKNDSSAGLFLYFGPPRASTHSATYK